MARYDSKLLVSHERRMYNDPFTGKLTAYGVPLPYNLGLEFIQEKNQHECP